MRQPEPTSTPERSPLWPLVVLLAEIAARVERERMAARTEDALSPAEVVFSHDTNSMSQGHSDE